MGYARDEKFDHWSSAPFRGLKRDIYEGGHHVPFVVRWPGVTKPGSVSDALVSQIDLMATIASTVGYELPDKNAAEDSHDLLPLLKGLSKDAIRTTHIHNTKKDNYAIRHHEWLLIESKTGYVSGRNDAWEKKHGYEKDDQSPVELYNFKTDPQQRKNLAAENPEKVKELSALLKKIRDQGYSAPRLEK